MKFKKLSAMILAGAMCFSLVACSSGTSTTPAPETKPAETTPAETTPAADPAKPGEGKTIGICIYKFDDNFMTLYRGELERLLGEKGYKVSIVDGNNDQVKQTEQINTFISQGVDALIVNPVMTTAAAPMIELVKNAGIPTVIINREPSAEDMGLWDKVSYVGADASQSGTFQGQIILETPNKGDFNGDGKVSYIMVQGDPENIDAKLRTEYSVKALTDAGVEVEELDIQRGDWDQVRGQEITATDLSKFGDKVEVVFCNNDAMALGALEAVKAAGRTVGEDIYVVGVDALADAVSKVASGEMTGTVLNDATGQATKAVEVLEELLAGNSVPSQNYVDYVKVTLDNVADYQ